MGIKNLIPWKKENSIEPQKDDFLSLQDNMNEMFDRFFEEPFSLAPWRNFEEQMGSFSPRLDVKDNDKEISISAELPGMEQENISLSLQHGVLTISGKKEEETVDEEKGQYYRRERSYGSFQRSVRLPEEIEEDKIDAAFKNGVLKIKVPKKPGRQSKKIKVRSE